MHPLRSVRMRACRLALIPLLLWAAGCVQAGDRALFQSVAGADASGDATSGPCDHPVDFATEVAPIFEGSCALAGCHAGPNGAMGLVLDKDASYAALVGVAALGSSKSRVAAGDAEASFLADRIQAANGATIMPPVGDPLPAEDVQTVLCWIDQGAAPKAADPCDGVTFSQDVAPVFASTCALAGCHKGPNGAMGLVLDAGAAYDNIVDKQALGSTKKIVAPGDPEGSFLLDRVQAANGATIMPPVGDPVPASSIDAIRCWIAAGATNDGGAP